MQDCGWVRVFSYELGCWIARAHLFVDLCPCGNPAWEGHLASFHGDLGGSGRADYALRFEEGGDVRWVEFDPGEEHRGVRGIDGTLPAALTELSPGE